MALWLYLMRHAQSTDKQPSQHDIDRELSAAGMREAAAVGHFLKKNNYTVDLIVSSGAKRAQATSSVIHGILNLASDMVINEELYQASTRNFLDITCALDDDFKNTLMVGHNPHITYFAEHLTKAALESLEPGGLVSIRFDVSKWAEVTEGSGSFENYIHPSIID